jgi:hypothetical protein
MTAKMKLFRQEYSGEQISQEDVNIIKSWLDFYYADIAIKIGLKRLRRLFFKNLFSLNKEF